VQSRTFLSIVAPRMPSSVARLRNSAVPPPRCCDTTAMFTETTREGFSPTSGLPRSSRIWPRTDGTITFLT
jgi:hypothetical protein